MPWIRVSWWSQNESDISQCLEQGQAECFINSHCLEIRYAAGILSLLESRWNELGESRIWCLKTFFLRLWTFPASLCASTPRSTLTSASSHPSEVRFKAVAVANWANELLWNCLDQVTSQVAGPAALRGRTPRRVMTRVPTPTSKDSFETFGNKSSGSEQDNVLLIYFRF